jgi:SAM-dependent methyltransferase
MTMTTYPYTRYLAAKKSVDDRAINRYVLAQVRRAMPVAEPRVLEIGAGLGTMVARLLEWQVISGGEYTVLDVDRQLLDDCRDWLAGWATERGVRVEEVADGVRVGDVWVRLVEAEIGDYAVGCDHAGGGHAAPADVLIANAVLDLVDVPAVLPALLRLLAPGGLYWFTINYDGETVFQPDHPLDDEIMRAYHDDMDERVRYGRPAGEGRTGRHLFGHLRAAGAPPLASGPSDWIVHAGPDGTYPHDEGFFVDQILATIQNAVKDRVDAADLAEWLDARRSQLATGDLVYIAHQLDFAGRRQE